MKDLKEVNQDWVLSGSRVIEVEASQVIEQRIDRRLSLGKGGLFYDLAFGVAIEEALKAEANPQVVQAMLDQLVKDLERDQAVKQVRATQTGKEILLEIDLFQDQTLTRRLKPR